MKDQLEPTISASERIVALADRAYSDSVSIIGAVDYYSGNQSSDHITLLAPEETFERFVLRLRSVVHLLSIDLITQTDAVAALAAGNHTPACIDNESYHRSYSEAVFQWSSGIAAVGGGMLTYHPRFSSTYHVNTPKDFATWAKSKHATTWSNSRNAGQLSFHDSNRVSILLEKELAGAINTLRRSYSESYEVRQPTELENERLILTTIDKYGVVASTKDLLDKIALAGEVLAAGTAAPILARFKREGVLVSAYGKRGYKRPSYGSHL